MSWFSQCWYIPTPSWVFQQKSKSFISSKICTQHCWACKFFKAEIAICESQCMAAEWLNSKGVLFWWSQVLSDVNNVGDICMGWKRSTEHGLDGQFCGVIDIWWQTETKNCTAQDAKVARALKFPGTYNASTFKTTVSLLRAVLSASSNNPAAACQSTHSHTLVQ